MSDEDQKTPRAQCVHLCETAKSIASTSPATAVALSNLAVAQAIIDLTDQVRAGLDGVMVQIDSVENFLRCR